MKCLRANAVRTLAALFTQRGGVGIFNLTLDRSNPMSINFNCFNISGTGNFRIREVSNPVSIDFNCFNISDKGNFPIRKVLEILKIKSKFL